MLFKYIERIRDNVLDVNTSLLEKLYESIRNADCIIPYGSGRSYSSIKIPFSQLAKFDYSKLILTPEDPGFPGNNMYDAASKLESRFNKILLIINSGSGKSEEPLNVAEDLARYIDEKNTDKFMIVGITSSPRSPIGELTKDYGFRIYLKGRPRGVEPTDYMTTGIMGDTFELGSLLLLQGIIKAMYLNRKKDLTKLYVEYFDNIDKLIDIHVESTLYEELVDQMAGRTNIYVGGRGSADEVAEMTVIRLFHVKYAIGDHVYQARGANTPRPRPGDIGIFISYSGETPAVIRWARVMRGEKCYVYSIVGNSRSRLAQNSNSYLPIEIEDSNGPRDFYMYASYILSPLPIKLIGRLSDTGLTLPERLLSYYHSTVE
jgi:D-arabinose 5-phosphate isomerase GutQ